MQSKTLSKVLFFCIITIFTTNCNKPISDIDDVPVDFYININDPLYRDLRVVGNTIMVTGGHAGIIVYRHTDSDFIAFDRICPGEIKVSCRLDTTSNNLYYKCSCCQTKFLILDGIGLKDEDAKAGEEKKSLATGKFLKEYHTYFDGVGRLRITN